MNINWFTFFAQIVNFVILVILLRRFLYGPVLRVMSEREAQIASRFKEAEELAEQAKAEAEAFQAERDELDAQRADLLKEARREAEACRSALIDDARSEVDALQESWLAAVQQEKLRFLQDLRTRMGETVYHVAQDALADLANAELEDAISENFLSRLRKQASDGPSGDGRFGTPDNAIIVRSAFELSPNKQEAIRRLLTDSTALNGQTADGSKSSDPAQASVAFVREPELICGIEAEFGSRRIAWSIRDYLDSYAQNLEAALLADVGPRPVPAETDVENGAAGGILPA